MKSKTLPPRGRSSRAEPPRDGGATAREHYRREKERRADDPRPDSELMEAAKREYLALLAEQAVKGKGGRPKKQAARPAADTQKDEVTEIDEE